MRKGGRHSLGETKTKRGRRRVNLTPRTVAALKAHRKRQLEERMRLSDLYEDWGLVLATNVGTPLNLENLVERSFKPLLMKAGLPEIRFHDLPRSLYPFHEARVNLVQAVQRRSCCRRGPGKGTADRVSVITRLDLQRRGPETLHNVLEKRGRRQRMAT